MDNKPKENVTLRFSKEATSAIVGIMEIGNFDTVEQAVARAISDELFLQKKMEEGFEVLLVRGDERRKVIWSSRFNKRLY